MRVGNVGLEARRLADAVVLDVADDADDLKPRCVHPVTAAEFQALAEWALGREIFFSNGRVDDHDLGRIGLVLFRKRPTRGEWNTDGREIVGVHRAEFSRRQFTRTGVLHAFDEETVLVAAAAHRQRRDDADARHAGEGADFLERGIDQADAEFLVGVVATGHDPTEREEAVGFETRVGAVEIG